MLQKTSSLQLFETTKDISKLFFSKIVEQIHFKIFLELSQVSPGGRSEAGLREHGGPLALHRL
jgi:hypothetical protein